MGQYLLPLVVALTVGAVVFGVTVLITGNDRGLGEVEPDGRAAPLPGGRPLAEQDIAEIRFDTALRGYRMDQVDQMLRRTAYDLGYKEELIGVLEAEIEALRQGRIGDAEVLRRAREAAVAPRVETLPPLSAGDSPAAAEPDPSAQPDSPAAQPDSPAGPAAVTGSPTPAEPAADRS